MTKINPTLKQQIESCLKLQINSFDGIHEEHNLLCPKCGMLGELKPTEVTLRPKCDMLGEFTPIGVMLCPNKECRVEKFFTA